MSVKKEKGSRFESNKQLRQIFSRHCVDLSQLTFSCSTSSLAISGHLAKNTGGEFTFKGVENLVEEINRVLNNPSIFTELDNWNISSSGISAIGANAGSEGTKKENKAA